MIVGKACIYCGVDLTGITAQDACPKCGKPAGYSLLGDHLRDAESTWLKKIVLGLDVLTGSFAILGVLHVISAVSRFFPLREYFDVDFVHFFLIIIGWLSFAIGIFFITRPESSGSMIAKRRNLANMLLASSILFAAIEFVPRNLIWVRYERPGLFGAIGVASVAFVFCQSLLWLHLRRSVIDRTPRREVARKLSAFFWISLILSAVVSEGTARLLKHQLATFHHSGLVIDLVVIAVLLPLNGISIYLLITTRKAIRRTVGYWDG